MNPKTKHVSFWIYLFLWLAEYSISKKYYLLKPKKVFVRSQNMSFQEERYYRK